jgi:hypothetical protein
MWILLAATALLGADPAAMSILEANCVRCHNASSKMGGVSLTSAVGLKPGVIVPGKPDDSALIRMVSGEKPKMPMGAKPLSTDQVAALRKWVTEGGVWSRDLGQWWSLKPLVKPASGNSIDDFVTAKLRDKGLTPSPEANRATLLRRLTYDLHGLPPAWEEVQAFNGDRSADAYEKVVDRLLASPRYGERWGRHWLDVVHYGESHGYDKDKPRRNAWPYRDYVIRAFNEDKPYKRFVEEQLAGDYLWPETAEGLIATGFIAAGPWDFVGHVELREGTTDKHIARLLDRDDMLMATMSTFTSMTAHCARCHDHKFDPIKQEDYYRLQAVFAGVDRVDQPYDADPQVFAARRKLLAERRAVMSRLQPLKDAAASVSSPELTRLENALRDVRQEFNETKNAELQPRISRLTAERKAMAESLVDDTTKQGIERHTAELRPIDEQLAKLPKPQLAYSAANYFDPQSLFTFAAVPRPITVLQRGSVESPGKPVGPGSLSCVQGMPSQFEVAGDAPEGARRAALAHWITAKDNMLTWRSIVNRVWQYHFGAGIVDSANDFGRMGSQPTHPELLDWLAVTFRDEGGSMKRLHRMIVTSKAYRQSSATKAGNAAIDAENRYLWRMNSQRLDAESVRDATLAISGKLDLTMGGPSAEQFWFKDDHSPVYDYTRFNVDDPAGRRRSVYRFLVRSVPDPFMDRLDCPDSSLITAKRNTTITAIQALALLNNPFMVRQAEHLASRVRGLAPDSRAQVQWLYRLALGRNAKDSELDRMVDFATAQGLENASRAMLNSNEFLFVD